MKNIVVVFAFLFSVWAHPAGRPTGIGSGDLTDIYLEAMRSTLVDTLAMLRLQPLALSKICDCDEIGGSLSCQYLKSLDPERRRYCANFLTRTLPQMQRLNAKEPVTPFELTDKTLTAVDPWGKLKPVIAQTMLGPIGSILFNVDKLKPVLPEDLLTLLGHEFGHKVEFGGLGDFIDDNSPVGPFNFPGGGRVLLNSAGAALSNFAKKSGLVGEYTGTDDYFSCDITDLETGAQYSSNGRSARIFRDHTGERYETGVGRLPKDFTCSVNDTAGAARLQVRLNIVEKAGCRDLKDIPARFAELQLYRVPLDLSKRPELLSTQPFAGMNPICGADATVPFVVETEVAGKKLKLELRYVSSRHRELRDGNGGGESEGPKPIL